MKKNNDMLYVLITVLGASTLILLGLFISFWITSNNYRTQLENAYKKNFYEVIDNINDLEVDMSKIVATTNSDTQKELLAGIYNTSTLGVNNINLLPVTYSKMTKINNFLNKIGGFSYSLMQELDNGVNISNDDYEQITNLHTSIKEIQYDLNQYVSKMSYDYNILDDIDFSNDEANDFSAGIINTESSNSKVPTLIYDGPFSDSVLNKEIVGLGTIEYSQEDVKDKLAKLFDNYKITFINESNGKFKTYNYNLESDYHTLYVSVSKQGGLILTITSFGGSNNSINEIIDGVKVAENFAKTLGIEKMYSVWTQKTGSVMYVNLAPIINHVIYYSDLIKVKVDLSTGEVIGWEATNYATNNKSRTFTSKISISEAEKNISPILEIKERNYTIIPDKYVGEVSAYEFICTWQNYTYYIYINSETGAEANILRVISTTNGDLLM